MNSLFQSESLFFNLPDAEITYFPNFISEEDANSLFKDLLQNITWQQEEITVYGKKHLQPRLTALYGNEGKSYSYSNIVMHPHHWTITLQKIKHLIENVCKTNFTTVLLNLYRDGNDGNGWHADNEKELGVNPIIASLSLGAERNFQLKYNLDSSQKKNVILENGSLLLMKGTTQNYWKHQIPKTTRNIGPRINLTFRVIQ